MKQTTILFAIIIGTVLIAVAISSETLSIFDSSIVETFESKTQTDVNNMFTTPWTSTAILDTTGQITGQNSIHITNRIQNNFIYANTHFEVKLKLNTAKRTDIVLNSQDYPNGPSISVIFGQAQLSNFPGQKIYAYTNTITTLWDTYSVNKIYHISFDFNYDADTCSITISDGINTKTTIVNTGNFEFLNGYSIGENTADFYLDDISIPVETPTEGQAHIMDMRYNVIPIAIETNNGAWIIYHTDNYGIPDTLWGHIVNVDTGLEIPDTYWEETIQETYIKTWENRNLNPYPSNNLKIEVGHIEGTNKITDDTYSFTVNYITANLEIVEYHCPTYVNIGEDIYASVLIKNTGSPITVFAYALDRDTSQVIIDTTTKQLQTDETFNFTTFINGDSQLLENKKQITITVAYGYMEGNNEIVLGDTDITIYIGSTPSKNKNIPSFELTTLIVAVLIALIMILKKKKIF